MIPEDLRYTAEHEWVAGDGSGPVRVGITHFAQDALGDIVFVDLPEEGTEVTAGEIYPIVESIVRRMALRVKDTLTELRPEVGGEDPLRVLVGPAELLLAVLRVQPWTGASFSAWSSSCCSVVSAHSAAVSLIITI